MQDLTPGRVAAYLALAPLRWCHAAPAGPSYGTIALIAQLCVPPLTLSPVVWCALRENRMHASNRSRTNYLALCILFGIGAVAVSGARAGTTDCPPAGGSTASGTKAVA